jgi:hypothetical protein
MEAFTCGISGSGEGVRISKDSKEAGARINFIAAHVVLSGMRRLRIGTQLFARPSALE